MSNNHVMGVPDQVYIVAQSAYDMDKNEQCSHKNGNILEIAN